MKTLLRIALPCLLAAVAGCASNEVPPPDDRAQALAEFVVAYRLADAWPRMAPKIARDSLPRLEDATHADLDATPFADRAQAEAAHARVQSLLAQGQREFEQALLHFDADEFADYTAREVYARHFDTAEIRRMSAFFAGSTGRKLSALTPAILAESRQPRAGDVMARHFDAQELAEIAAFWNSPVGLKMNATAEQVREEMHAHFIERSEPALQAVARQLAARAAAGDGARP